LTVDRWVDEVFAAIGADDFLLFALRETGLIILAIKYPLRCKLHRDVSM